MSAEENKAILRRFYEEVFNQKNLAALDEATAPTFVDHDPDNPTHDLAGARQYFTMLLAAFPNLQVTVEDMVAESDRVAVRVTASGTHQAAFMGIAPSGKQVTISGIDIMQMAGGKVTEHWSQYDALGMMQQLGVIPTPGQSGQ